MKNIIFSVLLASVVVKADEIKDMNRKFLKISYTQEVKFFDNLDPVNFFKFNIKKSVLYVSNFKNIDQKNLQPFIEKRKNNFLNLFQDDVEPYSLREIKRKNCLVQNGKNEVLFFSGAENDWAGCTNENIIIKKQLSLRRWFVCGNTVWEITLKGIRANLKNIDLMNECVVKKSF